jgi:hypothetical protein
VFVAGPGRYGIDAERSHGICESQKKKTFLTAESLLNDSLERPVIFCFAIDKFEYLIFP